MVSTKLRSVSRYTIKQLRNLNLFQSDSSVIEENEVHNQKIATRLFLVLLAASFTILLIYTSAVTTNKTTTIYSPHSEQYTALYEKYGQILTCPCTQIAIEYDRFLMISYRLHQLCSSDFISEHWFDMFYYAMMTAATSSDDFRAFGLFAFQTLRSICQLANDTISNSWMRLKSMNYISANVIPLSLFQTQISSIVKEFQLTTIKEFSSSLRIIRDTTQANKLFSMLLTNSKITFSSTASWSVIRLKEYGDCVCTNTASCTLPMCIYGKTQPNILYVIPGMNIGCYVFEALSQSDLRCFYNDTCLKTIQYHVNYTSAIPITVMNPSMNNRFLVTTTIQEILNDLMVDEWNWSVVYDNYFKQCQPMSCSYVRLVRNDAIYIVTATISLVGGLVTVLRLLVPRFIYFIRIKHLRQSMVHPEINHHTHKIRQLWQKRKDLLHFNLFPSNPPTNDQITLRQQLLSTHVFISLFISSLVVLLIYSSTVKVNRIRTIISPTLLEYSQAYENHAQTLTCPCSQISIDYEEFFKINYTFHAICRSDFIKDEWISYLLRAWGTRVLRSIDFRVTSLSMFHALNAMCILVNDTIMNSLTRFYSTKYVTIDATSIALFRSQMASAMNYFQSSTINEFLSALRLIRETTQSNVIFSAGQTNAQLYLPSDRNRVLTQFLSYNNCNCALFSTCSMPSQIFDDAWVQAIYTVPGVYIGCYVIEALLQSNLQCFYNQTCLQELMLYISNTISMNVTALNSSAHKYFLVNNTFDEILDELMVDEWQWLADYEKYFNICQPAQCSYSEQSRNDAIYIITTLLGLIGGLLKALRLIVPRIIFLMKHIIFYKRSNRSPGHRFRFINTQQHLQKLRSLNLFRSIPAATSQRELAMQFHATHFFLFFLISSLTILLIYTSTIPVTKILTVKTPTLSEYLKLYSQHASTLACPCTYAAAQHGKYLRINYTFHPVCSSFFIEDTWISYIHRSWDKVDLRSFDFRWQGLFAFQALRSFCQLVDDTLEHSLLRFYTDRYISMTVTPPILFQSQMNALVNQFEATTIREFLSSLRIIREYTQANILFPTIQSTADLYYDFQANDVALSLSVYNGTCVCGISSTCIESANIYNGANGPSLFVIPGFYIGCYVIESLLQSTLECFYNSTCVQQLIWYIDWIDKLNMTVSIPSTTHRFLPTNTVGEILNDLMVDRWEWSADYERYYNECQPTHCTHTDSRRNDLIYIVTTLIGLIGGLATALRLITPRIVFVFYFFFKPESTIVPQIFTVSNHARENNDETIVENIN